MEKYIVYSTWFHEKGLRPNDLRPKKNASDEFDLSLMRKNVKPYSPAEDVIWWKMDDNHHQSITIYSSEDAAKKHRAELEQFRPPKQLITSIQ